MMNRKARPSTVSMVFFTFGVFPSTQSGSRVVLDKLGVPTPDGGVSKKVGQQDTANDRPLRHPLLSIAHTDRVPGHAVGFSYEKRRGDSGVCSKK